MVTLIKRQVVKDRAFAAVDADHPESGVLAVAMRSADGWKVAAKGGRLIAERLEQRRAVALMLSAAREVAIKASVRLLFTGGVS